MQEKGKASQRFAYAQSLRSQIHGYAERVIAVDNIDPEMIH